MRILRYVWLLSWPAELTSAEAKMFAKMCAELETHVWVQCYFLLQVVHTTWQVNRPAHLTANSVAAIKHMGIHTHTRTHGHRHRERPVQTAAYLSHLLNAVGQAHQEVKALHVIPQARVLQHCLQ